MLKVFFLVFEPAVAWEKISQAKRGYFFILGTYLLPVLLLAAAVEGWGLKQNGKWQPVYQKVREFSDQTVLNYEIFQSVLVLAMVFISAALLHVAAPNFHGRRTYLQSFTTVAYGLSPLFFAHLLNYFAAMHPAIPWVIGILLSIWVLYQGVPRLVSTDPTHAFGAYLSAVFILLLMSGIVRLITGMFLLGQYNFKRSAATRALGEWLGQ